VQGNVVRGRMSGCRVAERVKQQMQKNVRGRGRGPRKRVERRRKEEGEVAEYMRSSDQTVEMR
jgi:hypothetical protein